MDRRIFVSRDRRTDIGPVLLDRLTEVDLKAHLLMRRHISNPRQVCFQQLFEFTEFNASKFATA